MMGAYVNGVLVPPVDAGTLDGIPADLTPHGAGEDGYVVTYDNATGDLVLDQPAAGLVISAAAPQPLGVAAAGATGEVSDAGHVHLLPASIATAQATANAAIPKSILANAGDIVVGSATGVPAVVAAVTAGRLLRAAGVNALPAYSTLTVPDTIARGSVLVATAANTVTALAAEAADTFLGGDGTDLVVRTAAEVKTSLGLGAVTATGATAAAARAAIGAGATESDTPQLDDGTGWTITDVLAGSGSIAGGTFTATIPAGTTSTTGANASRAWPVTGPDWEIQGRVQVTSDTDSELLAGLSLEWSGGGVFEVYCRASGGFAMYRGGGTWGFAALPISGSGFPLDGTGWVRMRVVGTLFRVWTGIGSGAVAPTSWTLRADTTDATLIGAEQPISLKLTGFSNNAHAVPAGTTVTWRSVSVRSFNP